MPRSIKVFSRLAPQKRQDFAVVFCETSVGRAMVAMSYRVSLQGVRFRIRSGPRAYSLNEALWRVSKDWVAQDQRDQACEWLHNPGHIRAGLRRESPKSDLS